MESSGPESSVGGLELLLLLLSSLPYWCGVIFAVMVLIDVIRTQRPWLWAFGSFFVPCIVPVVYFVYYYGMTTRGARRVDSSWKRARRLRELESLSKIQDTPGLHLELGQIHFERGDWQKTVGSLKRALELDPELPKAHYYAGRALLELGRADGAIAHLEYVVDEDPRYLQGEAMLGLGRAYELDGRKDDAFRAYSKILETTSLAEAVCRHAMILVDRGDHQTAKANLERLIRESAAFSQFEPARDRQWIRAAKKAVKQLED